MNRLDEIKRFYEDENGMLEREHKDWLIAEVERLRRILKHYAMLIGEMEKMGSTRIVQEDLPSFAKQAQKAARDGRDLLALISGPKAAK